VDVVGTSIEVIPSEEERYPYEETAAVDDIEEFWKFGDRLLELGITEIALINISTNH